MKFQCTEEEQQLIDKVFPSIANEGEAGDHYRSPAYFRTVALVQNATITVLLDAITAASVLWRDHIVRVPVADVFIACFPGRISGEKSATFTLTLGVLAHFCDSPADTSGAEVFSRLVDCARDMSAHTDSVKHLLRLTLSNLCLFRVCGFFDAGRARAAGVLRSGVYGAGVTAVARWRQVGRSSTKRGAEEYRLFECDTRCRPAEHEQGG